MANKKVSQLTSKPSVLVTDLFPIADPTTGQLFKTTISDLGTAIGSGVSSVNTLVGAVVLDTDDIQELASPTNRWFTDTRARAALSASSPLVYNSGTGAFSIPAATTSVNGYLTSADWTTFNAKQAALSGTGFVKISGTTISYDNSTYLTTSAAASTYLALAGGTLTGALNGTSANFSGDLTLTGTNPRFYLTDSDNNPDYFISNTDGTFTIYDVTNSVSRLTINSTTATLGANLTATSLIKSGGTSAQFLKADGSVDSSTYALDNTVVKLTGAQTVAGIKTMSNVFKLDDTLQIKNIAQLSNNTGYTGVWAETAAIGFYTGANAIRLLYAGNYNYTMPSADGTLALTSALSSYLPLAGGTLTGALSGTSASFTTGVSATNGYGFTSSLSTESITFSNSWFGGIDAIFQNSGNNNDFGIYLNGGTSTQAKLYITNAGAATFSSSVTATQFNASISTSGAVASVPNLAYFKNQGSGYVAKIAIGEGTTSDSFITHTGGNSTATQLLGFGVNAYNQMVLTGAGNVGIGTTSPQNSLVVSNSGTQGVEIYANSNGGNIFAYNRSTSVYNNLLLAAGGGSVGIGTTSPGAKLQVEGGEIRATTSNAGVAMYATGGNGEIAAYNWAGSAYVNLSLVGLIQTFSTGSSPAERMRITSAGLIFMNNLGGYSASYADVRYDTTSKELYYQTSSQRYKDNITSLDDSLSKIDRLRPVRYRDIQTQKYNCGLIAEEVIDVIPEVVFKKQVEGFDELQIEGINYSDFTPFLIKAIKELKAELDTLKNK